MSPSRTATPELRRSRRLAKVRGGTGRSLDFKPTIFPLLGLPNELLSNILSFLPIEDRLRVRVTKRLNKLEERSKYHVQQLLIEEKSITAPPTRLDKTQRITFFKEKIYSLNGLKKIAKNVSIGALTIKLCGQTEFHRKLYATVKKLNVRSIRVNNCISVTPTVFLDLSRICEHLAINNCVNVTARNLHQVYKIMMEGSTKLRLFETRKISSIQYGAFLESIGISKNEGRKLIVTRDIMALLSCTKLMIFDGNLEILFCYNFDNRHESYLRLKLHDTEESLERAKKTRFFVQLITELRENG